MLNYEALCTKKFLSVAGRWGTGSMCTKATWNYVDFCTRKTHFWSMGKVEIGYCCFLAVFQGQTMVVPVKFRHINCYKMLPLEMISKINSQDYSKE
jgi:hypothetical protein